MNIYKIMKWVALGLGVVGTALWVALIYSDNTTVDNTPMQLMFVLAYALLGIASILGLLSGFKSVSGAKGELKNMLIHAGIFIGVFVISYFSSSSEKTTTDKMVSTGLIAFYIYIAISVLLLIYTSVRKSLIK